MAQGQNIRTIRDAAAVVRGRRAELMLSQAQLAERAGVSRKWVYEFEAGKPTSEFGLLLRVLDALGLALEAASTESRRGDGDGVDLDELLGEYRES